MNCTECREQIVAYLEGVVAVREAQEIESHLQACPMCSDEVAEHTRLRDRLMADANALGRVPLDTRVMDRVFREQTLKLRRSAMHKRYGFLRLGLPAAAAAILLVVGAASLFHWMSRDRNAPAADSPYYLFTKACKAEDMLFPAGNIVHLLNQIVVKATSDAALAGMRWLPLASLQANGQFRFDQLTLPAKPGEEYIVEDQAWYDPATGRFARVLTAGGQPIFANSYDGQSVYSLDAGAKGTMQVNGSPVAKEFRPPTSPAEFLGLAAGLSSNLTADAEGRVQDAGTAALADGSAVRVLKLASGPGAPEAMADNYWLFRIRQDNGTIAEMEWAIGGQSLLVVRRVKTEPAETPGVAWNLAGLNTSVAKAGDRPKAGISPDMVVSNVSVKHMIEKASFETFIFATNPSWAGERQITDILDIPSPPHRMFAITYRAKDGRHVVLMQARTYNLAMGAVTRLPGSKLIYQSPKGFKVWGGPPDRMAWLAGILLKSAGPAIGEASSKQVTGYLLETPAGTFPTMAINGQVTDEELHSLIDSLVPAKEYKGE